MYLKDNPGNKKLEWSSLISVGLSDIDEQHKIFINLINESIDALNSADLDRASVILEELIDYAKTHFKYEKKLMLDHAYPSINAHEEAHGDYIEKVVELKIAAKEGRHIEQEMLVFLKNWLFLHIEGTDSKLGQFLLDKGYKA